MFPLLASQSMYMDLVEYKRREKFLENIKILGPPEYLEILRILRKQNVHVSENSNGVFFDVASLDQITFDELEQFIAFVNKNSAELNERELYINSFKQQ